GRGAFQLRLSLVAYYGPVPKTFTVNQPFIHKREFAMNTKSVFISSVLSIALLGGAGFAQADDDVSHGEALKLVEAGTIKSFEELDAAVLALHPGTTIEDSELELERGR